MWTILLSLLRWLFSSSADGVSTRSYTQGNRHFSGGTLAGWTQNGCHYNAQGILLGWSDQAGSVFSAKRGHLLLTKAGPDYLVPTGRRVAWEDDLGVVHDLSGQTISLFSLVNWLPKSTVDPEAPTLPYGE